MARARLLRRIRALPIAWRISLVVALNLLAALAVGGLGWHAALVGGEAVESLRDAQHRTAAYADIDIRASRLQGLIRQYLANPSDDLLKEAVRLSEALLVGMGDATQHQRPLGEDAVAMHAAARQFVSAFQTLKTVNADIARLYESQVLQTTSEISGLYAILNSTAQTAGGHRLSPALVRSHETFVEALIAINVFYFDATPARAQGARTALRQMIAQLPGLADQADSALQRDAIDVLGQRARALTGAIDAIARGFEERARILSGELDPSQDSMSAAIDRLITAGRASEEKLRRDLDTRLSRLALGGLAAAAVVVLLVTWASLMLGRSIRRPLDALHRVMAAGAAGDWSEEIEDTDLGDEIAAMARTVTVFRRDALEKSQRGEDRADGERRSGDATRRLAEMLLARIDGGDLADPAPLAAAPGVDERIARLFALILDRVREMAAEHDSATTRQTRTLDATRQAAREDAAFFKGLRDTVRPLLDSLALRPDGDGTAQALLVQFDRAMAYATLGPGGPAPVPRSLPIEPLIDDLIRSYGPEPRLSMFVDPGLPTPLMVDSERFDRLLGRLIDNALRFGGGGPVRLFAERRGPVSGGRVEIVLRIVDQGPGMPPAVADRLFQPFVAAPGVDGTPAGLGLGLATARRLAHSLNGRIEVESRPGLGTTMQVRLLLTVAPGRREIEPDGAAGLTGKRVLVAVPDPDERGLIALVTEQAGAAVVRVRGAREALAASRRASTSLAPFDLAILSAEAIEDDSIDALAGIRLLLIESDDPERRFALERLPGCLGVLGRPLGRRQIFAASLRAISSPFSV